MELFRRLQTNNTQDELFIKVVHKLVVSNKNLRSHVHQQDSEVVRLYDQNACNKQACSTDTYSSIGIKIMWTRGGSAHQA
ncbi:hypothetical protein Leryth_014051 [Lithospermum erythrorhizon]|nr:hypothetical protein Leryth_014051 [Lithospermum erythrorhizon]